MAIIAWFQSLGWAPALILVIVVFLIAAGLYVANRRSRFNPRVAPMRTPPNFRVGSDVKKYQ